MASNPWALQGCCNYYQTVFLICSCVYAVVILLLWRTFLLTPFKLITVYLHELSHALACKMTGGKVEGMEVHLNEGGVTKTRGGWKYCILPAGYLGSSFWGMALIMCSTNEFAAAAAAAALCVSLIIVVFIADNWTLRILCLGFLLLFALFFWLQFGLHLSWNPLCLYVLFIGVMNCMFSVYDIYDDLISRRVNSSDAEVFARECPCPLNGPAWGVIWGFISLALAALAVYLSLVILNRQ